MARVSQSVDDTVMVAVESGAVTMANGDSEIVRIGMRLRASHELVRRVPDWFAEQGSDEELRAFNKHLFRR